VTDSDGSNCSTLLHVRGEGRKMRGRGKEGRFAWSTCRTPQQDGGGQGEGKESSQKACETALRLCTVETTRSK
jgi:hypothetical protein